MKVNCTDDDKRALRRKAKNFIVKESKLTFELNIYFIIVGKLYYVGKSKNLKVYYQVW